MQIWFRFFAYKTRRTELELSFTKYLNDGPKEFTYLVVFHSIVDGLR